MRNDPEYLGHILECIRQVEEYTLAGRAAFMRSRLIQDAVARNFEIMGEAAKKLTAELRQAHADVPWRRIAGFRDVLIHDYPRVDWREVWNVVERELPKLKLSVQGMLKPLARPVKRGMRRKPDRSRTKKKRSP